MDIEHMIQEMTLEEKIRLVAGNGWWHTHSIDRLGIPSIRMSDGPYGLRVVKEYNNDASEPATCFPVGVSMGITWNEELVRKMGLAMGEEALSMGVHIILGPTVNIHRSPLAGRNFESFSEDPFLSAKLAKAYIKGVQSQGVAATVKHFALNNSEFERMTMSSEVDDRTMREIYLPAFEVAVKEGKCWAVMSSYNKINGQWASENFNLLSEILKEEWEYDGIVMSDWFAYGSTVGSAKAGLDLEMPGPPRLFGHALMSAICKGDVRESTMDDKVRRILRLIKRVMQNEKTIEGRSPYSEPRKSLLREAAQEAIVLLKNEPSVLPLDPNKVHSIAVVGPNADAPRIGGGGSSKVTPHYSVSPLQGLEAICGKKIKLRYEKGCTNHRLAPEFDPVHFSPQEGSEEKGLLGAYYTNTNFEGEPLFTRVDTTFVFGHGSAANNTSLGPGLDPDLFSVRWNGVFRPPVTGTYRFSLLTNGFCRITVNQNVLVDKWKGPPMEGSTRGTGERIGEMDLTAGQSYAIKVEYCQNYEYQGFRRLRLGCDIPLPINAMDSAEQLAADSDVALVFVGLTDEYDAEFKDREDMDLPGDQIELIKNVSKANANTIVVLSSGSPVSLIGWLDGVPAVIQTGYIGQEAGNAIADILFGLANPSGKLTETYPKRLEDTPAFINYPGENGKVRYGEGLFVGYRYYDKKKIPPAFPFGHGLSYTTFEYEKLIVKTPEIKSGENVQLLMDITNTGKMRGKEVVQLYVRDLQSSLIRPPKELKGFQKIDLEPGQSDTLDFQLTPRDLSFYDPIQKKWICEPGAFEILLGSSSSDIRLKGSFLVQEP